MLPSSLSEGCRLQGKSSIAAQLSKILTEKVIESLLNKSSNILDPQAVIVLRDRWTEQLRTRGFIFRDDLNAASDQASNEMAYCNRQRNTKRHREEVPPLEKICDIFSGSGNPQTLNVSANHDNRLRIVYKVKAVINK